jgi:hypothetical protein
MRHINAWISYIGNAAKCPPALSPVLYATSTLVSGLYPRGSIDFIRQKSYDKEFTLIKHW